MPTFVPDSEPKLQSLLAACQAADDPIPALSALADWLEARGDPRSQVVRLRTRHWQLDQQQEFQIQERKTFEAERRELWLRICNECFSVVEKWLGFCGDRSTVNIGWYAPLLDVQVKVLPDKMPQLAAAFQTGWVWELSVTGTAVDEILAELLSKTGPVRCITFYENEGLRNDDLALLGEVPHLRELGLGQTRISDAGLRHLYPIKTLRQVWLFDTRVTQAGIEALRQALPECRIA
jgi:hypothetical protein